MDRNCYYETFILLNPRQGINLLPAGERDLYPVISEDARLEKGLLNEFARIFLKKVQKFFSKIIADINILSVIVYN